MIDSPARRAARRVRRLNFAGKPFPKEARLRQFRGNLIEEQAVEAARLRSEQLVYGVDHSGCTYLMPAHMDKGY